MEHDLRQHTAGRLHCLVCGLIRYPGRFPAACDRLDYFIEAMEALTAKQRSTKPWRRRDAAQFEYVAGMIAKLR